MLAGVVGDQGKDWSNCISAHPTNGNIAALGWDKGPCLTFDGGSTWRVMDDSQSPHLHADLHALVFSIEAPETIGFLFAGSDGGVAKINLDDLDGVDGPPIRSDFNRHLPTLQCYSMLFRQFTGSVDISAQLSGVLAAGLQDNGNVSCRFRPVAGPWAHVDWGDGGLNISVRGGYLHNILDSATAATPFGSATPFGPPALQGIVPITIPPPADAGGLKAFVGEAVARPRHRNGAGQLLLAVASAIRANTVYGVYAADGPAAVYQWQQIGVLPAGQTVAGLGSFNGDRVFAGTAQGKIYIIDTNADTVVEQTVKLPKPSPSTRMSGGAIERICGHDAGSMFAVLRRAFEVKADGTVPVSPAFQGYVLKLENGIWSPTPGAGLPNEYLYGFVAVVAPNTEVERALLAATDDSVYISRDEGKNWRRASLGLPRRPHCGDLRFVIDSLGEANIMLGTFGRSVWLANLA